MYDAPVFVGGAGEALMLLYGAVRKLHIDHGVVRVRVDVVHGDVQNQYGVVKGAGISNEASFKSVPDAGFNRGCVEPDRGRRYLSFADRHG